MEKRVSKLLDNITPLIFLFLTVCTTTMAQESTSFDQGKLYTLGKIEVTGIKSFSPQTVIAYTGLRKGQQIRIPGDDISAVINKLWKLELFSDINFYLTRIEGDTADIEIFIQELPTLSDFTITGVKKNKMQSLIDDTGLKKGLKISESFLETTENYIINKYRKDGFLNTKVTIQTKKDTVGTNSEKLLIFIDRGDRVKINSITFDGNDEFNDRKLRKKFKNTKTKFFGRFWKKSKFIEDDYNEDLTTLIDYYKEKGHRDARVIADTIIYGDDKIDINVKVVEGNKYYFGDINFLGNSVYSDEVLGRLLGVEKGDTYNGVLLRKRIADPTKPDGEDLTNLYQNNGYLFSSVNPVEISAVNDTINFEIRIIEGKPAYFNRITVVGNDRTNDHVIYREIRTKPGALYSKDLVVRSVRELGQLGFFDPEQISPDFKNVDPNAGTVDIEYGLVEKGASQIELQGGYGGGGFIGTLGLSFSNFSMRNIWNR